MLDAVEDLSDVAHEPDHGGRNPNVDHRKNREMARTKTRLKRFEICRKGTQRHFGERSGSQSLTPESQSVAGTHYRCFLGSVASMMALTDFWLNPLKPPLRSKFSRWLPMAPSLRNWLNCFWSIRRSRKSRSARSRRTGQRSPSVNAC